MHKFCQSGFAFGKRIGIKVAVELQEKLFLFLNDGMFFDDIEKITHKTIVLEIDLFV